MLPTLVEKTLERGWRAVVQAGSQERLAAIDLALWTYKEDSFLAHGSAKDGHAAEQPVYLTTTGETPNGAGVRFLVDGAEAEAFSGFVRIVYMFDGNDADAVKVARGAMDGGQERRLSRSPTGSRAPPANGSARLSYWLTRADRSFACGERRRELRTAPQARAPVWRSRAPPDGA